MVVGGEKQKKNHIVLGNIKIINYSIKAIQSFENTG